MKKQRQQTIIIITGIVIAFIISLNLVKANAFTELKGKNLATIHTLADEQPGNQDAKQHVIVFDNQNQVVFEIEAEEAELNDNIHLKRFLALCDFVLSSGDFVIYHLNK